MKIDGIDTEKLYGVKEWKIAPAHMDLSNANSSWPEGWNMPFLMPSNPGLKTYKVTMMIKSTERKDMWMKASRFIGALMEPRVIEFKDFDTKFYGVIKDPNHTENVLRRWHKLEVDLIGYEYGNEESFHFSGKTNMKVVNYGTIRCPCTIEITPTADISNFKIYGLTKNRFTKKDEGITFLNLIADKTVVIDRKTGKMKQDGTNVANNIKLYQMPALEVGENTIETSASSASIKIAYNPIYA